MFQKQGDELESCVMGIRKVREQVPNTLDFLLTLCKRWCLLQTRAVRAEEGLWIQCGYPERLKEQKRPVEKTVQRLWGTAELCTPNLQLG